MYESGGEHHTYQKTAIYNFLEDEAREEGFHFSNHDLRRTCGRRMYHSGARIKEIATHFGHADTRTTIKCLGLDFEDMSGAIAHYAPYQNQLIFPQVETFGMSQKKGGPIGI